MPLQRGRQNVEQGISNSELPAADDKIESSTPWDEGHSFPCLQPPMRQTLFHIPQEIARVPVFGWGWLLLAWTLFVAGWLLWLIVRRRSTQQALGLLPFAFTVALAKP